MVKERERLRQRNKRLPYFTQEQNKGDNIKIFKMLFMNIKVLTPMFIQLSPRGIYIGHDLL